MKEKLTSRTDAMNLLFSRWEAPLHTETIPVEEAFGRVPVGEYYSAHSIPVVRASAMDGVAVISDRFQNGRPDTRNWRLGEDYVRADTGDDFDDRFDAVIRIEDVTIFPDGGIEITEGVEVTSGTNVRGSGSSFREGTKLIHSGLPLRGTDLAALAMGGVTAVEVIKRPKVAFIPTGSELIPIGAPLQRGCNYDTNSLMAKCILQEMGAEPVCMPILRDDPAALKDALHTALEECDLVILNGGSSKGDEDYNTRILASEGELLLHGVSAGPGRPIGFALINGKPVLNISGPAIGAFYSLDWCVRPIICKFLRLPVPQKVVVKGKLTADMRGALPMDFLNRVEVTRGDEGYRITPMGRGQADLPAMLRTNAMFISPVGESFYPAGTELTVELLRDESLIPYEP